MKIRKTYIYEPSATAYMVSKIKEIELLRLKFRYIEIRYREDQSRDEHGRFTDEGGSSANNLDSGTKIGYTERKEAAQKMSAFERKHVSSGIMTDHPNLRADGFRNYYEYGDYQYVFKVHSKGVYEFLEKRPVKDTEDKDEQ